MGVKIQNDRYVSFCNFVKPVFFLSVTRSLHKKLMVDVMQQALCLPYPTLHYFGAREDTVTF